MKICNNNANERRYDGKKEDKMRPGKKPKSMIDDSV